MLSELAFDQWKVEEDHIAKRVDRYETKARWKQKYASPALSPQVKGKGKEVDPPAHDVDHVEPLVLDAPEMEREIKPRAYSVSISRSPSSFTQPRFLSKNTSTSGNYNHFVL